MKYLNLFAGIFCAVVAGMDFSIGYWMWGIILVLASALNLFIYRGNLN